MSEPEGFSMVQWRDNLAGASRPQISANDDLRIDFDESHNSTTCDIFLCNQSNQEISVPNVSYDDCLLIKTSEPVDEMISPFDTLHYSFTAIHYAEKRVASTRVMFLLHDGSIFIRTIRINYGNDARHTSLGIVRRRRNLYDIPEAFVTATSSWSPMNDVDCLVPSYEEMDYDKYQAHFHGLLYLEELNLKNQYKRLERADIFLRDNGNFHEFVYPRVQRPAMIIGDRVTASKTGEKTQFNGTIADIMETQANDTVVVKFPPHFRAQFDNSCPYTVTFTPNRTRFIRMHKAIDIVQASFDKEALFPTKFVTSPQPDFNVQLTDGFLVNELDEVVPWFNEHLNVPQKLAVKSVLRADCPNRPYIINGPPGTGKTTTAIEVIWQLLDHIPKCRLLVVTQSNNAADVILDRLISNKSIENADLIRIASYNYARKANIVDKLKPYFAVITNDHNSDCGPITLPRLSTADLASYQVVITTTLTAGLFLESPGLMHYFSHALVDEAGQCSEMEVAIPMAIIRPTGKLVLVGDPKQMRPICIDLVCKRLGYEHSLLSRMLGCYDLLQDVPIQADKYDSRMVTQLSYNYRTLPSILNFFNRQFYELQLIPQLSATESLEAGIMNMICNESILPANPNNHAIYFRNVCGTQERVKGTSPCNYSEAREIHLFVETLISSGIPEGWIGIVTPYALQVNLLKTMLVKYESLKIGTVEEFQGDERYVILVSTVRSPTADVQNNGDRRLGFIQCESRINVAVSRARCLLYVFGCERILYMEPNWTALIDECKEMGTYFGDCSECRGSREAPIFHQTHEIREVRESREVREAREIREAREFLEARRARHTRENHQFREHYETQVDLHSRGNHENREHRETSENLDMPYSLRGWY